MGLLTSSNLLTLNYIYNGQPFVNISATNKINFEGLDYIYLGQPFFGNGYSLGKSLKTKIRGAQIQLEDAPLDVATDSIVFWVPNN
jgi:hypothetical protein